MAKQALDKFKSQAKDVDVAEQALLTTLLRDAFPRYESYEDVPWTDLDVGKAILAAPVALMCSAVARRIRSICDKPTYSSGLAWAGYETVPDFHHLHLFKLVFKRLIRKKVDYDRDQLAILVRASFASTSQMPRGSVLAHVERGVANRRLKAELRRALTAASKSCWDEKLQTRIAAILKGKTSPATPTKKALFRKPDPWAAKADKDVAESSQQAAWKQLLRHCMTLKNARPSQTWARESTALVDQIGQEHFVDRMMVWLGKVPQFAAKDRHGVRSAESYEAGNATLLRGLVWSLPKLCTEAAPLLHKAALGCAKKVPDVGPRSSVVANACYGKLGHIGDDEALRLLFDLRYNTNYSTLVRGIDKAISGVADVRKSSAEKLETAVGARAASAARVSLSDDGADDSTDLLSQIYRNPGEESLRAVYADTLTEAGDPRGEFIVLQLLESPTKEQRKREVALYKKHRERWLGPLERVVRSGGLVYRAGFPAEGRLYGGNQAELHALAGHPAWATFEQIDADGQYDRIASPAFFSQPVFRARLRSLTGLHVENLAAIATDKEPWSVTQLGLSAHTSAEEISSDERDAIGAALSLPLVQDFVIDAGYVEPSEWQWLLDSKLGQQLQRFEVIGSDTPIWLPLAASLAERMQEVLLRPSPFFGGCKYLFERKGKQIHLSASVSAGDAYKVERLEAGLRELAGAGLTTLRVRIPKGAGRTKVRMARLAKICDAMQLESYSLPKAKG